MLRVQSLQVSLGETGREPVSRGVAGSLGLLYWGSFMPWGLCSLLCGFPLEGLGMWDWCVDGDGRLDSFRTRRFSRENAGLGSQEAKDNGKRETKVMTSGPRLAAGSEEERESQAWGVCV